MPAEANASAVDRGVTLPRLLGDVMGAVLMFSVGMEEETGIFGEFSLRFVIGDEGAVFTSAGVVLGEEGGDGVVAEEEGAEEDEAVVLFCNIDRKTDEAIEAAKGIAETPACNTRPKLAAASAGLPTTVDAAEFVGGIENADDATERTPPSTSAPTLSTCTRACVRFS